MVGVVESVVCFDSYGIGFVAEHISPILISFPWSNCVLF